MGTYNVCPYLQKINCSLRQGLPRTSISQKNDKHNTQNSTISKDIYKIKIQNNLSFPFHVQTISNTTYINCACILKCRYSI